MVAGALGRGCQQLAPKNALKVPSGLTVAEVTFCRDCWLGRPKTKICTVPPALKFEPVTVTSPPVWVRVVVADMVGSGLLLGVQSSADKSATAPIMPAHTAS